MDARGSTTTPAEDLFRHQLAAYRADFEQERRDRERAQALLFTAREERDDIAGKLKRESEAHKATARRLSECLDNLRLRSEARKATARRLRDCLAECLELANELSGDGGRVVCDGDGPRISKRPA